MSGKKLSNSKLYRLFALVVILGILVNACGEEPTPAVGPTVPVTTPPTNTPPPTATPRPTATPTEIPIVLPTATPPQPQLPPTKPVFLEPFTPLPTATLAPNAAAVPTPTPAPTVTPYVPPFVVPMSIYQVPAFDYADLDRILPPNFSTRCIQGQYFPGPSPTPPPTATPVPPGVIVVNPPTPTPIPTRSGNVTPVVGSTLKAAKPNAWVDSFQTRWLTNQRLNSFLLPAPTFTPTPKPTATPTIAATVPPTPLPFPTNDVFTGLTAVPTNSGPTPTAIPSPTATRTPPPAPTSTPSVVQRLTVRGDLVGNFIQSVWITDVNSLLPKFSTQPVNFVVMWHVMNDVTLAMVNFDTPLENYLRAYEQSLDETLQRLLNISLRDPNLKPTGEERYANRKIILGNVPDLRAFRFFKPCFTDERIRTVQNSYNQVISRVAAKYPGRVYIADLSTMAWTSNPLWVTPENGFELTTFGAEAVADVFGRVFEKLSF